MSFVRAATATTASVNATSIAATLAATVGSGNFVCGICTWGSGTTGDLSSVTDDKGNSYTIVRKIADTTNSQSAAVFYKLNITNAPITITANFGSSIPNRAIGVIESNDVVSALGVETGQLQSSPTNTTDGIKSGAVTTSGISYVFGGSVDVGAVGGNASEFNAGTNFTERAEAFGSGGAINLSVEDLVQGAAGSAEATFTKTASQTVAHITFVLTVLTGSGAPTPLNISLPPDSLAGINLL